MAEPELERYRAIFESAVDFAIIATDREGRVTDWNTGAERILGWSAVEMRGEPVDRFFTPEDRAGDRPGVEMRGALEAGRASDERWHLRRDGSRFWATGEMMPLEGGDGAHLGYLKIMRDRTEQRRAAAAQQADAEFLRGVLASSGDCIKVLDLDAKLIFMSEGGQRIMEVSDFNAIRGCSWPDFWRDEGNVQAKAAVEAAQAGGIGRFQGAADTMAGTPRYWDVQVTPILGADGRPERLLSVSRDVTEIKRAEVRRIALLELGDHLRDLDDPAQMAFVAAEIMGRAFAVDRAGYGTIDAVRETITIERDWTAPGVASLAGMLRFRDFGSYIEDLKRGETVVFADAEQDPRTAATADALKGISARSVVNHPIFEHGRFVALFFLTHADIRAWSAEDIGFVRNVADRTRAAVERRRAEARLQELNETLERRVEERTRERDRVWSNSRDLLVIIGADGIFRAINPAWTAILGHHPTEVIGRSFLDFIWPDDADLTQGGLDSAVAKKDLTNFENRYRHKDGTPRWISWHTSGEGDLIYAYGRDVTAQRDQADALHAAEEQLRQAQKMEAVGQLTGGLAHDFNNLLVGISGSLEMMQARIKQGRLGEIDRYVTVAQGAAKRAATLTHRLLAFSRRQTLDPKPVHVNRLVAGMEELIRRTMGPSVELEVVGAAGLWTTLIDPHQLENALLNLCVNARDAMPDGGRLTIETANTWLDGRTGRERDLPPGQYLSLCVTDTGIGMTPEVLKRAFDPFFTTKPIGMGTGLGLSMVYGFARQSGGQVRIYSELGRGTTMCLYLPRHHGGEDGVEAQAEPDEAPGAGQGKTVLVVDDEAVVRMLVAEVLDDLGFTAIEAVDGAAGLRVLQSDVRLDLLITDVGLPGGMNGRQVADAGRAARPGLRVLFITGYAENAAVGNGHLEPGMQVLTKPFAMDALASRIKDLVAEP